MSADINTTNRVGVGTAAQPPISIRGPNPLYGSRSGTPKTMTDSTQRQPEMGGIVGQRPPPGFGPGKPGYQNLSSPAGFMLPSSPPSAHAYANSSNFHFAAHNNSNSSSNTGNGGSSNNNNLMAPHAMPPHTRLTSPQPIDGTGPLSARSPSPSKRGFIFPMGEPPSGSASDRWNSIGQTASSRSFGPGLPRKQSMQSAIGSGASGGGGSGSKSGSGNGKASSNAFSQEPFLGYNELFSPTSTHPSDKSTPSHNNGSGNVPRGNHNNSTGSDRLTNLLSNSDPVQPGLGLGSASGSAGGPDFRGMSQPQQPQQQQDTDHFGPRFDPTARPFAGPGREDHPPFSAGLNGARTPRGMEDFPGRSPFGMPPPPPGMPPHHMHGVGDLSPRSMMHLQHQQMQALQSMAMQTAQQGLHPGSNPNIGFGGPGQVPPSEEITTVFIVGFPDDMTEREFANMFLFARGFEASTLKVPFGSGQTGPGGRLSEGGGPMSGPGGPYTAVSMPGAGLFDLPNGQGGPWDDHHGLSLALSRAGASDSFSSLANMGGMANALPGAGGQSGAANPNAAGAKIKQIIGFAKFRTRSEALEARDALHGRRIDAERGCVLKTEMAKKNLHTKQRPVLSGTGGSEGGTLVGFMPPSAGGPAPPLPPQQQQQQQGPSPQGSQQRQQQQGFGMGQFEREPMPFQRPRSDQQGPGSAPPPPNSAPGAVGPDFGGGGFPSGNGPSSFEPIMLQQGGASGPGPGPAPNAQHLSNNGLMSPRDAYGPDPFSPGAPQPSHLFGGVGGGNKGPLSTSASEQSGRGGGGSDPVSSDAWSSSMGPLDYFGPEAGPPPPPIATQRPTNIGGGGSQQQQQHDRPDWNSLGSPSGLANIGGSGPRPSFSRQLSRGPFSGPSSESVQAVGGSSAVPRPQQQQQRAHTHHEDFGRGESTAGSRNSSSPPLAGSENRESGTMPSKQQLGSIAARFGPLRLGSPPLEADHGPNGAAGPVQARPSGQIPSPDLPSPTGRGFVGDNHPPVNTLFVGNLPSSASSAVLAQIEEQLKGLFASRRGYRQFSFQLKSNGPMCFVEFEDVHCASAAMSELNGNTLVGTIKNGGIRLSFSKNPLFRMNSSSSIHQQHQHQHQQHQHSHAQHN